jgi:hypothetical protein
MSFEENGKIAYKFIIDGNPSEEDEKVEYS